MFVKIQYFYGWLQLFNQLIHYIDEILKQVQIN